MADVPSAPRESGESDKPTVIKISPMAHLAAGFLALGILALVFAATWLTPLLLIPLVAVVAVVRYRTVVDGAGVTARTLLHSTRLSWAEIQGLKFVKGGWARAVLGDGREVTLPAVTFGMLPLLTEVSAGRVPNPYN